MTRSTATLILILLGASPWTTPLCALAAEPTAPAKRDVYEIIERGRLALLADKFQEAADVIEAAGASRPCANFSLREAANGFSIMM